MQKKKKKTFNIYELHLKEASTEVNKWFSEQTRKAMASDVSWFNLQSHVTFMQIMTNRPPCQFTKNRASCRTWHLFQTHETVYNDTFIKPFPMRGRKHENDFFKYSLGVFCNITIALQQKPEIPQTQLLPQYSPLLVSMIKINWQNKKKEWNIAIFSNMDGPREYQTKWSQRQIYDITYTWDLKNNTNESI